MSEKAIIRAVQIRKAQKKKPKAYFVRARRGTKVG